MSLQRKENNLRKAQARLDRIENPPRWKVISHLRSREFQVEFRRAPNRHGRYRTRVHIVRGAKSYHGNNRGLIHKAVNLKYRVKGDKPSVTKALKSWRPKTKVGKFVRATARAANFAVHDAGQTAVDAALATETVGLKGADIAQREVRNKLKQEYTRNAVDDYHRGVFFVGRTAVDAVQVSKRNFPEIVHHGDVFDGDFTEFKGYDLLLGGSPCTFWSIARKDREITSDGMGFKLFMEYVRALRESGCKYFLYENNYSIHQNIKDEISKYLGVQPIMINSSLLSAQHRKRCYWTNIPNVRQPDDKGIMLADILENGVVWQDKSYCMTSSYQGAVFWNTLERSQRSMVAVPISPVNGKSHTVTATYAKGGESPFSPYGAERAKQRIAVPVGAAQRGRYVDESTTEQHIEVRDDDKSNCLTTVQKRSITGC